MGNGGFPENGGCFGVSNWWWLLNDWAVKYLLSLDQGTTSSRAILFDGEAKVVASGQNEFAQIFPCPGWVEHDPEAIWESQRGAIEEAFALAGCGWESVHAIGITNQRETVVAWDAETGEAVGTAIVWQDRRTAAFCDELKESGKEPWIQERTGLVVDPYFSASKMRWLLENRESVAALERQGQLRFGTIDSWLVWKLSAGAFHVTDVSNASRTQLFNLERCEWDEELLALFGVSRSSLPAIVDSSGDLAQTSETVTGGFSIPVTGMAGDQQAALFGQFCFEPGMAKCTYGTGCFVLMQVGGVPVQSKSKLLATVAWRMDGKTEYALEGSVFMGGASVQWLRDGLGIIESAADVGVLAASVEDSGGVVVVPAFTGLGAPYWDPHARGAVLGLTRGSSKAHVARATLEGIAFQVVDLIRAMESDFGSTISQIRADGGASASDLLMQIQADLSGVTVACPEVLETTAMGVAFLAGLGSEFWSSREEIRSFVKPDRSFEAILGEGERLKRHGVWLNAVECCRSFRG